MSFGTIEHPNMTAINAAYDKSLEPPEYEEAASIYYQGRTYGTDRLEPERISE